MFQSRYTYVGSALLLIAPLFILLMRILFHVQFVLFLLLKLALRFWSVGKGFQVDHSTEARDRIHLSERRIAVKAEAS